MRVQRVRASDQIEATRGRVALRYGPLMYNIESVDQPVDGALDRDAELTTKWRSDLLEGVVVIHGKFSDGSAMMAIPNYARNNRIPMVRLRPPLEGEEGSDEQPVEGRGWRRRDGGRSLVWMQEEAE
jgi:hypothetical protein